MDFKKAYKFPLKYDGMSYVWGKDNGMVLMFDIDDNTSDEFRYDMVKCLNEEDVDLSISELAYIEGDYFIDGKLFMIQRGWGNLTSPNCLGLSTEAAIKVQDEFAEFVLSKLNHS